MGLSDCNGRIDSDISEELKNLKDRLFSVPGTIAQMTKDLYGDVKISVLSLAYDTLSALNLTGRNKWAATLAAAAPLLTLGTYGAIANPAPVRIEVKGGVLEYWNGISDLVNASSQMDDATNSNMRNFTIEESNPMQDQEEYTIVPVEEVMKYMPDDIRMWHYSERTRTWELYDKSAPEWVNDLKEVISNKFYWLSSSAPFELIGMDPHAHKPKTTRVSNGWYRAYEIVHPRVAWKFRADPDSDGLSNLFERKSSKTDPLAPNMTYVLLMNTREDGKLDPADDDTSIENAKKYLVLNFGLNPKHIETVPFSDSTVNNFKEAIDDIARKSTANDSVFIIAGAHGNQGTMSFQCPLIPGGLRVCDNLTYKKIDEWIDRINAKVLVLLFDVSYSHTMIDDFKDGPSPRIIYPWGFKNFLTSMYGTLRQWNLRRSSSIDLEYDENNDGQISFREFLGREPPNDSHNLAARIYFGELISIPFGWDEFKDMKID